VSSHALFAVAPYVAALSLLGATAVRYVLLNDGQSQQRAAIAFRLFLGNRLWRAGLLGVAIAHALMLLLPKLLLRWNQDTARLIAMEAAFCGAGVVATAGLLGLLQAHVREPGLRKASSLADVSILGLLLVLIVSGLCVTVLYRWASAWSAVTLTPYVHSLVSLRPRVPLIEPMPYVVRLHTFSAIALLALLPFSHFMDLVLAPVYKGVGLLMSPLRAAGRRAWSLIEPRARLGLGWRDDEDEAF
jgi:nitrate reductase gamma subunit